MRSRSTRLAGMVAIVLEACSSGRPAPDASAWREFVTDAATRPRCRVTRVSRQTDGGLAKRDEILALAAGPDGVRVFERAAWWGRDGHGPLPLAEPASVAWLGDGYLVASARTLGRYDAQMNVLAPRRALAPRACDVRLLALGDGAAMLYRRPAAGGCDDLTPARAYFQRLAPDGSATGPLVSLFPKPSTDEGPARTRFDDRVVSLRARLDAGRIVAVAQRAREGAAQEIAAPFYTVLALDGSKLALGEGESVACPLAGCVRFVGRADPSFGTVAEESDRRLRVVLLGRESHFKLAVDADAVLDAAVSGDRVLLVLREHRAEQPEGALSLAVFDAARRELLPLAQTDTRRVLLTVELGQGGELAGPSAVTTQGFAVVTQSDMVVHTVECDP